MLFSVGRFGGHTPPIRLCEYASLTIRLQVLQLDHITQGVSFIFSAAVPLVLALEFISSKRAR